MNRLKKLHRVFAGASFAATLMVVGYSTASNAQTSAGSVFNDSSVNPERSGGFFDNGGTGSPTRGITEMIHNAVLGPKTTIEDFSVQQNDNLNAETNEFLKRRQEQLKRQAGGSSSSLRPVMITPENSEAGDSQSAADALKLTPASTATPVAPTEAPAKN
ncbi:MAG TPA: hypothetical protein IGS53_18270 [Leptolyngbyaceae cyanobacterium M33_DOE_097]|uniref:Low temperature-induced protein n=1 Tax=Oscillatoriales cyanobacterium SpSt-418 TaxID=2282169 RepID=A0A7C3PKH3_9CYAN|nr:hypothetical protein [Leptolyngbyaceae cyanobacterium M33_DOE_097]